MRLACTFFPWLPDAISNKYYTCRIVGYKNVIHYRFIYYICSRIYGFNIPYPLFTVKYVINV